MIRKLMMSAALALMGSTAMAAVSTDDVIQSLSSQGFTRVEIKRGLTQVKVKAIRGDQKLDLVLDAVSGRILKQNMVPTLFFDNKTPGFFVSERRRDFLTPDAAAATPDGETQATLLAPAARPAPATGHVGAAMAVRVTEDYAGADVDTGSDVGDGMQAETDIRIDDGAFIGIVAGDYFPIQAVDADGDGVADPVFWDGDGIITIDDGWYWGGDPGIFEGDPGTDDGSDEEWVDGSDEEWVDGSDEEWVDDGSNIVTIMPVLMMPPVYIDPIDGTPDPAEGDGGSAGDDAADGGEDPTDGDADADAGSDPSASDAASQ